MSEAVKTRELKYIVSSRGGKLLVLDNYIYQGGVENVNTTNRIWRCATLRACEARVVTQNGAFLRSTGAHCHATQTTVIQRKIFANRLKERVKTESSTSVTQIYREEVAAVSVSGEVPIFVPSLLSIEKTLYNARTTARTTMVHQLDGVSLLEPWKKSIDRESLLTLDEVTTSDSAKTLVNICSDSEKVSRKKCKGNTGPAKPYLSAKQNGRKQELCDEEQQKDSIINPSIESDRPVTSADKFDVLVMAAAKKIRTMDSEQQKYVENIINRALSLGSLGQLSDESDIYPTNSCRRDYKPF